MVLEKTLESPLDSKEIQPVHPKRNQSWIFIGRTEAKAPIFGHLMWRTDLFEKTLVLGKIEGRRWRGWQRMKRLDGITNSMDITLPTKAHIVKAMVSPVVMYRCENQIIKKAERQRIDAFELCCWRRHLRVPWTERSNLSILKEISPEYSLEGLMMKLQYLATWCEELTHWKRPWCRERLKAKGEGGSGGSDG